VQTAQAGESRAAILEVRNLQTVFKTRAATIHAVNNVSFSLKPGELLGVVGESGSGKSVTMMSLMRLLPSPPARIVQGSAMLGDRDLLKMDEDDLRKVRGAEIGFIFQDPMTSLNPVFTVGFQLMEPLREHLGLSKKEARARWSALRRAGPSLYRRAAEDTAELDRRARGETQDDPRPAAASRRVSGLLPVRAALPARIRTLP
jgi:ABC-type dipeptide/oligopeptide/nickel transport system ATPase component